MTSLTGTLVLKLSRLLTLIALNEFEDTKAAHDVQILRYMPAVNNSLGLWLRGDCCMLPEA